MKLAAQWTTGSGGIIYYNGGSVGVGIASPAQKLDVESGTNYDALIRVGSNNSNVELGAGNGTYSYLNGRNWDLAIQTSGTNRLYIPVATGYVGIGTTSPQHLLHVAGTIGAEQVIVSATGADYVFDPGYRLAPLREVAAYVNASHHLPGIPTAEDMKREGVSLGDMQTKLLAKVEELTLHMIAADERNTRLEEQNRELIERDRELQARMAALEHHAQGNTTTEKEKEQ